MGNQNLEFLTHFHCSNGRYTWRAIIYQPLPSKNVRGLLLSIPKQQLLLALVIFHDRLSITAGPELQMFCYSVSWNAKEDILTLIWIFTNGYTTDDIPTNANENNDVSICCNRTNNNNNHNDNNDIENLPDGYTTDDITYQWDSADPLQLSKNLNLPRFATGITNFRFLVHLVPMLCFQICANTINYIPLCNT